jgi:hypothetical protein
MQVLDTYGNLCVLFQAINRFYRAFDDGNILPDDGSTYFTRFVENIWALNHGIILYISLITPDPGHHQFPVFGMIQLSKKKCVTFMLTTSDISTPQDFGKAICQHLHAIEAYLGDCVPVYATDPQCEWKWTWTVGKALLDGLKRHSEGLLTASNAWVDESFQQWRYLGTGQSDGELVEW